MTGYVAMVFGNGAMSGAEDIAVQLRGLSSISTRQRDNYAAIAYSLDNGLGGTAINSDQTPRALLH